MTNIGQSEWNQASGNCTRAYADWEWVQRDIRGFLALGTQWMSERFEQVEREVREQPAYDGGPDLEEAFLAETNDVLPADYLWMQRAAVLRDGVTAFEVYHEQAGFELLKHRRKEWPGLKPGKDPSWGNIINLYSGEAGIEVDSARIQQIRKLRHILTHQRGQLRTAELRDRFETGKGAVFSSNIVALDGDGVLEMLDDLGVHIRKVDEHILRLTSGRRPRAERAVRV